MGIVAAASPLVAGSPSTGGQVRAAPREDVVVQDMIAYAQSWAHERGVYEDATRVVAGDTVDHLHQLIGRDLVTFGGKRPLTVFMNDRLAAASPYALTSRNEVHFGAAGPVGPAELDRTVVAHEVTHIAVDRMRPFEVRPDSLFEPRVPARVVREDAAVREGLSDVMGAIHGETWQIGGASYGSELGRDLTEKITWRASPAANALRARIGGRLHDVHDASAPVAAAFHGTRELGWDGVGALFGGTLRVLERGSGAFTYREIAAAMRESGAAMGVSELVGDALRLARMR